MTRSCHLARPCDSPGHHKKAHNGDLPPPPPRRPLALGSLHRHTLYSLEFRVVASVCCHFLLWKRTESLIYKTRFAVMFKVSTRLYTHERGCLEQREVPEIIVKEVRLLALLL